MEETDSWQRLRRAAAKLLAEGSFLHPSDFTFKESTMTKGERTYKAAGLKWKRSYLEALGWVFPLPSKRMIEQAWAQQQALKAWCQA